MYRPQSQSGQLEFLLPFGGHLDESNRWVRLAKLVPWEVAEQAYAASFTGTRGPRALSARVALGTLIIKERCGWTDRETVEQIRENPYLQYFLGFREYVQQVPFDASMLVHFRSRLGMAVLQRVNEALIASQIPRPAEENVLHDQDSAPHDHGGSDSALPSLPPPPAPTGEMIIDATCTPADITYPTDLKVLNHAREITEQVIDVVHLPLRGHVPKPRTYRHKARQRFLAAAKSRRLSAAACRTAIGKQLRFLRRNLATIKRLLAHGGTSLGLLERILYRKLLVASEIYRQQECMYRQREHRIDDRIVNLAQPHVRPIVRGKAGIPVEFGAKISASCAHGFATLDRLNWSAFNEGGDLALQAERYRARHGCYPATIRADGIYRTRDNRQWCTERGIRLAGPPLGRPPIDPTQRAERARTARTDERARVPIEGVFGVLKRRYSLGRIMTKLANTSESVIALAFLVMNLTKIHWARIYSALRHVIGACVQHWLEMDRWTGAALIQMVERRTAA